MQSIQESRIIDLLLARQRTIIFAEGLLRYPRTRVFTLRADAKETPLLWLESQDCPGQAFLLVDPFLLFSEYSPVIPENDKRALQIERADECLILCFVHTRNMGQSGIRIDFVNPVVVNWRTGHAKQVALL